MKITCFDREKDLYIIKIGNMIEVNIVKNVKIVEVTLENMCSTFF